MGWAYKNIRWEKGKDCQVVFTFIELFSEVSFSHSSDSFRNSSLSPWFSLLNVSTLSCSSSHSACGRLSIKQNDYQKRHIPGSPEMDLSMLSAHSISTYQYQVFICNERERTELKQKPLFSYPLTSKKRGKSRACGEINSIRRCVRFLSKQSIC